MHLPSSRRGFLQTIAAMAPAIAWPPRLFAATSSAPDSARAVTGFGQTGMRVLGAIPRDHICVTSRARLGFHTAWRPDEFGRPVISRDGTDVLMSNYPPQIRNWIFRHGGLSPRLMYLNGTELASMYPACEEGNRSVVAGHRSQ